MTAVMLVTSAVGFIPSPPWRSVDLGPVPLNFYGLCLALGVIAAWRIAEIRWERKGGDPRVVGDIGIVVVIAGVIGARVYHLFTGYDWERGGIVGTLKIWEGGLSIWGAVAAGALAAIVMTRRRDLDAIAMLDAIAPGVAIAQAIGRWGNWFNQELYGKPTRLPWAVEIDRRYWPDGYSAPGDTATFHPTFLYESLWMVLVFAVVVWAERRFRFRRGQTFALYVSMYTGFRVLMEWLRVDPASKILGVRWNGVMSAAICVVAAAWFVWLGRHGRPGDAPLTRAGSPAVPAVGPADLDDPPDADVAGATEDPSGS
jgi:prolipoprotein diacylglyceryl transferase